MIINENNDSEQSSVYYENIILVVVIRQKYLEIIQKPYNTIFIYNNYICNCKKN